MKCPIDQEILAISNRDGIEIDYCPSCRGVWLDRGELDKIIEKAEVEQSRSRQKVEGFNSHTRDDHYEEKRYKEKGHIYPVKKKKRDSFLGDMFDF